jgi:pimeloyl-ACP methyl ester carboxylesterase
MTTASIEHREIAVEPSGATVFAVVRPGPRPLLFVHGFAASGAYFADAPERDELGARGLVVIDLPGFGQSAAPVEYSFTMQEQARTVGGVAEALDLEEVTLVGHSMGGTIAVLAADILGDRLEEVVLAEAILQHEPFAWTTQIAENPFEAWANELERLRRRPAMFVRGSMVRRRPDAIDRVASAIDETTPLATYRSAVSLRDTAADSSLYARFRTLARPARYLFGDRNLDVPLYRRLGADGVRVVVIPRAGHLMMLDNPAGFYGAVAEAAR